MIAEQSIGNIISEKRKQKNLTQEQLAGLLMISTNEIIKWENDQAFPSIIHLEKLNKYLGVNLTVYNKPKDYSPTISKQSNDLSKITKVKDLIKAGRLNKGLSVNDLASLLSVSDQAVENWESGYVVPTIKVAQTIANLLKIDFQLFYKDSNFLLGKPELRPLPQSDSKVTRKEDNKNLVDNSFFSPPFLQEEREYITNKIIKEEKENPHLTQTLTSSQATEFFNTLSIVSDESLIIMDIIKSKIEIVKDSKSAGWATYNQTTDSNNNILKMNYQISYIFDDTTNPYNYYYGFRWNAFTFFHELGHIVDFVMRYESKVNLTNLFPRITEFASNLDSKIDASGLSYQSYLSKFLVTSKDSTTRNIERRSYAFLADVMGSFNPKKYGNIRDVLGIWGHGNTYYNSKTNDYIELMAEWFLDDTLDIKDSLAIKKKWLGDDIIKLYKRYLNEFISRNLEQWRNDNKRFLSTVVK